MKIKYMLSPRANKKNLEMPGEEPEKCNHLLVAMLIAIAALLIVWNGNDGFRSPEQKDALASQIISGGAKPEYGAMKSIGLDGAEFYEARQLWNKNKFTKDNVAKIL